MKLSNRSVFDGYVSTNRLFGGGYIEAKAMGDAELSSPGTNRLFGGGYIEA